MAKKSRKMKKINPKKLVKFKGGSIRSSEKNKGTPALMAIHALMRISKLYEKGRDTYGSRNWEIGQSHLRYANSLFRHLLKYLGGAKDEDHLAAIAWNAMAIMQQEELIKRGLMDNKFDDVRAFKDKNGKQLIPENIFLPNEFDEINNLFKK